jgi:2-polyprenyl-6-methoxyphenol hydroxylase-like FAD-dependent oxidoreductase
MEPIQSYKQQRIIDRYDVIVIGSGLGGLSVSAILAKEGKKVLVLEHHYTAGGYTHVFKRRSYEWDVGLHYVGEVHRLGGCPRIAIVARARLIESDFSII